jgi:ribosomal protein L16 Arg81 hydroxylase
MISDLKSLVDPLGQSEFLTLLRERKLTFLPGCGSRRFETLLNWETLNYLLDSATLPLTELRVVRESVPIPSNIYVTQDRVDVAALSKLLDRGVSLVFNKLHAHVPALRALCKNVARDTLEQISAAAVVTSGRGGAAECHFDPEDLIILQIAGTKRWQVFFNSPSANPVLGIAATPPEGPPIFDQVLQPGDRLFLPARYWHHCENGPHRSLHVSILFAPPNGRHLMDELVSRVSADETFSRPLTRHTRPESLAEHEAALKVCLVEAIRAISLDRFLTQRAASRPFEGIQLERRTDQAHDVQA